MSLRLLLLSLFIWNHRYYKTKRITQQTVSPPPFFYISKYILTITTMMMISDEFQDMICQALSECPSQQEMFQFFQQQFLLQHQYQYQHHRMIQETTEESTAGMYEWNDEVVKNFADDATWILTSSFVILTMQSGFGLLEMGSSAPGNEVNIMMKNVFDVVFGGLAYFCLGYGISFGVPSNPFMGLGDFFPNGGEDEVGNGLLYSSYLFQLSFAATSTTIVSGCVAMRMRFFVYCAFAFYAVVVYSFCAHWTWAEDGWLLTMGYHDFAGSGPVHLFGAINGLVAILLLGPRFGRFDGQRPKEDFRESSPTSILFGLFMLWWGWIGFNCGSSFGITSDKWLVATRAAVTTISCTAGGGLAALFYTQIKTKGRFVLAADVANGILGSLVASSACCASIRPVDSLIIGSIGSILANSTNDYISCRLRIDDPVGAVGVHGAAAIWGILSVGLFADGNLSGVEVQDGVFRGGGFDQFILQVIGVCAFLGWSVFTVTPFFYIIGVCISGNWKNPRAGLRISMEEELKGADVNFHNAVSDGLVAKELQEKIYDLEQTSHNRNFPGPQQCGTDSYTSDTFNKMSRDGYGDDNDNDSDDDVKSFYSTADGDVSSSSSSVGTTDA